MNVAVIRGSSLNKWEMQSFEPLVARWSLVACGARPAYYPTRDIRIPVKCFARADSWYERGGVVARLGHRLGLVRRPPEHLVGLERFLSTIRIAHAAETAIISSQQAVLAKERYGCRVVLTCWETIPFAYETDSEVQERRAYVRARADVFVATTTRAARALATEGVDADRIRVLMPGVDTDRFCPAPRSAALACRLGLEESDLLILFIGRLIGEKGPRELIVAFSKLLKMLPTALSGRCKLMLAGSGGQREYLIDLARQLGVDRRIRFFDGTDYMSIHEYHQMADIFVLPSISTTVWEEQFGMVLAEAMACGKPVISTTTGAIPEVVGEAGLLIPPLDSDALADALSGLISDSGARSEMGRIARDRAVKHFSVERFADALDAVYRTVLH